MNKRLRRKLLNVNGGELVVGKISARGKVDLLDRSIKEIDKKTNTNEEIIEKVRKTRVGIEI